MTIGIHTETFEFGDIKVTARACFFENFLRIDTPTENLYKGTLDEYTNYEGDMRSYAKSKYENRN